MNKISILAALFFVSFSLARFSVYAEPTPNNTTKVNAPTSPSYLNDLEKKAYKTTALLMSQTSNGGMRMMCTVTAFEKTGKTIYFASAAHCVAKDIRGKARPTKDTLYITFDDPSEKKYMLVKNIFPGYQHRGDDFAVLEVETNENVTITPLAANDALSGESVFNFASPGGFGIQIFRGHVSLPKLQRPLIEGDINWKGAVLIQIPVGPGSSGSSVVSNSHGGIVAFIVGMTGNSPSAVAIPVSKFKTFWIDVRVGKYKWYDPKSEEGDETDGEDSPSIDDLLMQINQRFYDGVSNHTPPEKNKIDL